MVAIPFAGEESSGNANVAARWDQPRRHLPKKRKREEGYSELGVSNPVRQLIALCGIGTAVVDAAATATSETYPTASTLRDLSKPSVLSGEEQDIMDHEPNTASATRLTSFE